MPHETAAVSVQVLCTPYNHAPICHFMQNQIHKVYVCLAVTCHLHFWQNDPDLLCATAVTQGWNGYQNKSQHRNWESRPRRRKFSHRSCKDSIPQPFNHESSALTTELSLCPCCCYCCCCCCLFCLLVFSVKLSDRQCQPVVICPDYHN